MGRCRLLQIACLLREPPATPEQHTYEVHVSLGDAIRLPIGLHNELRQLVKEIPLQQDARAKTDAQVKTGARVKTDARVKTGAWVKTDARVKPDAWMKTDAAQGHSCSLKKRGGRTT
eukprot:169700-Pelagomonas_calceolata.AAC.1